MEKQQRKKCLLIFLESNNISITATKGNLNNHIGVPLTMLSIKPENKYAVVEIGTNAPWEISFLSELAQP